MPGPGPRSEWLTGLFLFLLEVRAHDGLRFEGPVLRVDVEACSIDDRVERVVARPRNAVVFMLCVVSRLERDVCRVDFADGLRVVGSGRGRLRVCELEQVVEFRMLMEARLLLD